jgi:fumarate hydratase, class II
MSRQQPTDVVARAEAFIRQDHIHEPMHDGFLWATMQRRDAEAVAFAGSQGNFDLNAMRPIINNFLHSARVLGDACEKLRRFSVVGTRLNRTHIDEMLGRSLMLVTALSPVIGYDKAAAIAHKANDEGLTLKEAALKPGCIDEKRFDAIVDPKKMVGHGVAGS